MAHDHDPLFFLTKTQYGDPADDSQFDDFELAELAELAELSEFGFDVFAYIKTLDFELRKWAIENNIRLVALSALLKILKRRGHPSLPIDARTLLKTPKKVNVFKMGSGECWYGGLKNKLTDLCKKKKCSDILELTIHIDGTPIYKSSKSEFWPVQCSVNGIEMKSFFVQLYKGSSKPNSAELFIRPLLNEIDELLTCGLPVSINGQTKKFEIRIDKFILDAPARAFLKCIIGHGGYFSCERCEEEGEYLLKVERNMKATKTKKNTGHVYLIGTNAPLRTDESFRNQENQQHHHDHSPLEELAIDIVRDIPLEYLHLILYGAMKRLLTLWVNGTKNFKLSDIDASNISEKHMQAGGTKPSEINKPNRSLKCLSFWKATEFRTFLLKTGPVALRGSLTEEMYNHFLALHCAVTICCSESLIKYLPVAKCLFRSFTEKFGDIYGNENYTYSIHSLIHVIDDVERFGVFDLYSAFPGESNLGFLKNLVRGGHLPLQQVVKRIAERDSCEKICEFEEKKPDAIDSLQKNVLRMKGLRLDSSEKNRWLLTKKHEIFKIDSILKENNVTVIQGAKLVKKYQKNLYELPIESKSLFIYKSKLESTPMTIAIDDMFCKLYRIEINDGNSAFFPLFHYTQ